MSTTRPKLAAESREITGKAVAHLRRSGRLPAVVFGHGVASSNVSVDTHEFEQLQRHVGPNALVDLAVDGKRPTPVLIHGVQRHRINSRLLHVDLYVVRMTEELTVDVPLVATGSSEAVNIHGGTLIHPTERLRVKALPDHLPQSISYSIDGLATFDDMVHVRDLDVPADVTLLTDPDEVVARVLPPRVEEVEVPAAEAEGEAPAEGEGEAPAEGETPESASAEG
jgi:large subunit ribosomal protein L25